MFCLQLQRWSRTQGGVSSLVMSMHEGRMIYSFARCCMFSSCLRILPGRNAAWITCQGCSLHCAARLWHCCQASACSPSGGSYSAGHIGMPDLVAGLQGGIQHAGAVLCSFAASKWLQAACGPGPGCGCEQEQCAEGAEARTLSFRPKHGSKMRVSLAVAERGYRPGELVTATLEVLLSLCA